MYDVPIPRFVTCTNSELYVGKGGYITLADHPSMIALWLILVLPLFLSTLGLYMALVLYKYGVNFTISLGALLPPYLYIYAYTYTHVHIYMYTNVHT